MSKTQFSIAAVHRMTGKARSTIAKHMREGKLAYVVDDDGKRYIEGSEIARVYKTNIDLENADPRKNKTERTGNNASNHKLDQILEQELENERQDRLAEREQLKETIEHLRKDLERAQSIEACVMLLFENHSQDTYQWKSKINELENRITTQEQETRKYRRAWKEERDRRNQTIWKKLFG